MFFDQYKRLSCSALPKLVGTLLPLMVRSMPHMEMAESLLSELSRPRRTRRKRKEEEEWQRKYAVILDSLLYFTNARSAALATLTSRSSLDHTRPPILYRRTKGGLEVERRSTEKRCRTHLLLVPARLLSLRHPLLLNYFVTSHTRGVHHRQRSIVLGPTPAHRHRSPATHPSRG